MPNPLRFYPAYCFPASPTFGVWTPLTAAHVHALKPQPGFEGQKILFHLNHPIKWVRLTGIIVDSTIIANRFILQLDDSSGVLLELVCPVAPEPPKPTTVTAAGQALPTTPTQGRTLQGNVLDLKDVDIGTVVKVKGGLGAYRGVPQLLLERIAILPTTTAEATAWHSLATFHSTILSRPWLLSATDERRLRASADKAARATRRPASAEVPRPARHVAGAAVVAEGARLDARTARGAVDRDTGGKQNTRPALVRVRDEARARDGVAGQTRGDDGAGPAGARVRVRAGVVGSGGEGRVGVRFIKRAEAALLGGERGGKGREG